jgi:GH25 family lysozyme M1 (1,4-beta-N-acetylmuramidase)
MRSYRTLLVPVFCVAYVLIASLPALAVRPLGVDVSNHQTNTINWSTLKNTDGVSFAWAKATEGLTFNDSYFTTNETGAKAAGVYIGAYHFARPDNQVGLAGASQEEDHFWNIAKNYIKGGNAYLMPMLDIEQDLTGAGYTKASLSAWVNQWCNDLKADAAAAGVTVTPVVYTYISYASTWLDSSVAQNWPLWMANYNGQDPQTGGPNATSPWQTDAWQFWQYTSSAHFQGIASGTTNVDADVINGDANTLKDYIVGSAGRFNDGSLVKTTTSLKCWDSSASNGSFVVEPAGTIGTILQGPVYGASYQRWQIHYSDGHIGWSAEDFLSTLDANLPGDFNGDGKVNAADYITWRRGQSPNPNSSTDLATWRQHFGSSSGAGAGTSIGSTVPEPTSLLYVATISFLGFARRRKTAG